MKPDRRCAGILLLSFTMTWAQEKPQEQPQQNPPTLGPEPAGEKSAPSLYGPRSSTTTDARRLLRIHSVYIETIDNGLNEKLAASLSARGPFRVVGKRNEADGVLRGTCFDSRRLKTVHSEVFLTDLHGTSIWQDVIRQPYNPPPLTQAVIESAHIIVAHISESIREAQRK